MLKPTKRNDIPNKNPTVKKGQVPDSLPKKSAYLSSNICIVAKSAISLVHSASTFMNNTALLFVLLNTWPVSE